MHRVKTLSLNEVEQFFGVVYFASRETDNLIKIGVTSQLQIRLEALQGEVGQVYLLGVIPGWYGVEQAIHLFLDEDRVEGEWFRVTDRVVHFIDRNSIKVILPRNFKGQLAVGKIMQLSRCKAQNSEGGRCRLRVKYGHYCYHHKPAQSQAA